MRKWLVVTILVMLGCCRVKSTNLLETFRRACPYNDFCTVSSLKSLNSSHDTQPCCFDCFCDEYSVAYGDSCPDYFTNNGTSVDKLSFDDRLECKALYYKDVSKTELTLTDNDMQFLRYIDFCPPNYNGNEVVRAKCKGNYFNQAEYDDIVAVSNPNGVLFKNKFCARCHGEENITRWDPKVLRCIDNLDELQMSASEMKNYVLQNCILTSSRPDTAPLNSRTFDCREDILVCEENLADKETKQACLIGPRMPIIYVNAYGSISLFRNVICANCGYPVSDTCPRFEAFRIKSFVWYDMEILLNFPTREKPSSKTSACREFENYDHHMGLCRRLYCPPLEVTYHGECMPITQQASRFLLNVKIVYRPENNVDIRIKDGVHSLYNETLSKYYQRSLELEFLYPNCQMYEIRVFSYFSKMSKRFQFITVDIVYKVNNKCPVRYIGKMMQTVRVKNRTWLLHSNQIQTYGHITFFDTLFKSWPTTSEYEKYVLFSAYGRPFSSVQKFFLCPYFILDLNELRIGTRTKKVLIEVALTGVQKLTPISSYQNGVFPLSENKIAVCVEIPQGRNFAGSNACKTSNFFIFFVFWMVVYQCD